VNLPDGELLPYPTDTRPQARPDKAEQSQKNRRKSPKKGEKEQFPSFFCANTKRK